MNMNSHAKPRYKLPKNIIIAACLAVLTLSILYTIFPTQPEEAFNIPLGVGVTNPENINFLNSVLREYDVIAVRPHLLNVLDQARTGRKALIFGVKDYNNASTLINKAIEKGASVIGYNLEGPLIMEEMIRQEATIYNMVKERGLTFMSGPTVKNLEKYYREFASYTDIIIVQSQRYQTEENYKEKVNGIVSKIRSANPDVKVWVQVSVNPPGNPYITADEVVSNIREIIDIVDGVWIYYHQSRWNIAKEVIRKLRTADKPAWNIQAINVQASLGLSQGEVLNRQPPQQDSEVLPRQVTI